MGILRIIDCGQNRRTEAFMSWIKKPDQLLTFRMIGICDFMLYNFPEDVGSLRLLGTEDFFVKFVFWFGLEE